MNIQPVIDYLNKNKGYSLSADYYNNIDIWQNWWKGFYKPFHEFKEVHGDTAVKRKLYKLKMAKKVCEDWASILLNEKTAIAIDDKLSSDFVQGKDQTGGVFYDVDFWNQANALVEKAFYSGTGAFVVKVEGMAVNGENILSSSGSIQLDYLTASNIIPITFRYGRIIDVAFVSEVTEKGKKYVYLETHILTDGGYRITNEYFTIRSGVLILQPLPAGIAPAVVTGSSTPLFAVFSPNIVNNIDGSNGLGISIYSDAIDNLQGVDLGYNNFCRDLKLGGKKVFYNQELVRRDSDGNALTPDDIMQQLFVQMGDSFAADKEQITEYNPTLRVEENKGAVQAQLDYLSFKCGLGTKRYQFNPSGNVTVTATQYNGDRQEMIQNANKHYIPIEKALKQVVRAILWVGREILGQPVDPDTGIKIVFEDSYIIDKEAERQRDLQDVRDGIMQKWEYRVKWYGDDEETAKKMVGAEMSDDEIMFRR